MFEDGETLFQWNVNGGVDGDFVGERVTTKRFRGAGCLHLATPATTPATNDEVQIQRFLPITSGLDKMSFSAFFMTQATKSTVRISFSFTIYAQSTGQTMAFIVYWSGTGWYISTSTGAVAIGSANFKTGSSDYWHFLSLTAYPNRLQYGQVQIDDAVFTLTDHFITSSDPGDNQGITCTVTLVTLENAQKEAWFDDVTLQVE